MGKRSEKKILSTEGKLGYKGEKEKKKIVVSIARWKKHRPSSVVVGGTSKMGKEQEDPV